MKKIIVLYGLPAAGKTTQAELLVKKYGFYQFGMGDKLRAEIDSGTELGKKIQATVASGLLISNELMKNVLQNVKQQTQETGIVFDGFPRIVSQAELLEEMLTEINREVDLFLLLKISPEEAEKRINQRSKDGGRGDDKDPEAINNRFNIFRQESVPLIAHYKKLRKFIEIDGEQNITDVLAEIEKYL
jgi:adenylate kinase